MLPALPRHLLTPLIIATALFMENLDATVISTSLPAIAHDSERLLRLLLAELPLKSAVRLAADITGAPRNALYERALALKSTPGNGHDGQGTPA